MSFLFLYILYIYILSLDFFQKFHSKKIDIIDIELIIR